MAERTEYLGPASGFVMESYIDSTRHQILREFALLNEFLTRWKSAKRNETIIKELAEYGIEYERLAQEEGKGCDLFDLICHVAYDQPPLTRKERAEKVKKHRDFAQYGE